MAQALICDHEKCQGMNVMAAPPGPARDEMIRAWCASVWQAWQSSRSQIVNLLKQELDLD